MTPIRSRHKPDLFSVLLIVLALGMSVTLAYQGWEQPYDTDASRAQLIERLKAKHASSTD